MGDLAPGDVVWTSPPAPVGREQGGRRPALVISGTDYLETVNTLAIVVPITSVDRGWPNHVPVAGASLPRPSWAMTEQVGTVSRERIVARAGRADPATLSGARDWVRDFLDL